MKTKDCQKFIELGAAEEILEESGPRNITEGRTRSFTVSKERKGGHIPFVTWTL